MKISRRGDRGVAALEFALIAPALLLLVAGIVEFGDRYKTAALYNNAALVAARSIAINDAQASATTAARSALTVPGKPASTVTPTFSFKTDAGLVVTSCAIAADGTYPNVTVTVVSPSTPPKILSIGDYTFLSYTVTGRAVVRCAV